MRRTSLVGKEQGIHILEGLVPFRDNLSDRNYDLKEYLGGLPDFVPKSTDKFSRQRSIYL
jgi:hypothetical protein